MALFKCKMCGGELDVHNGETVTECPYCGTKQTLPKLNDDKKINLYDRADHFRRNNEYDKAADIYEKILEEDKEDSEAYWSLLLCRYGVEYVEDPETHKRIPTINRAQYTSVFLDEDYLKAIEYADGYQKDIYQEEAKQIDDIQKNILEISSKEDPFDVFICYKETDVQGRRTQDSVYAQDIYNSLTKEGYRVFFSRITLEDKLGTAYEPYIFAALNSAKVMIVVGTSADNFNAIWVKNEWSRFFALIKSGKDKVIIPVYKNMDPYDLPDEFAYLQAQDMGKVGFMQDLVYGVKKIINPGKSIGKEIQTKSVNSYMIDTLMHRASDSLAKQDWNTANRCYDSVLDYDSQNIDAYLGKLLVDFKATNIEKLKESLIPIETNSNYKILNNIADDDLKIKLQKINSIITKKRKKKKNKKIILSISLIIIILLIITSGISYYYYFLPLSEYNSAMQLMEEKEYYDAIKCLNNLEDKSMPDSLKQKVSEGKKEIYYQQAKNYMSNKEYDNAINLFKGISIYKDSINLLNECKYQKGLLQLQEGKYNDALETFNGLYKYKDSMEKADEIKKIIENDEKEELSEKYNYCKEKINKVKKMTAKEYAEQDTLFDSTFDSYLDELIREDYPNIQALKDNYDKLLNRSYVKLEYKNVNNVHEEPYYYFYVNLYNTNSNYRIAYNLWNSTFGDNEKEDWINSGDYGTTLLAGNNDDYVFKYFKLYDETGNMLVELNSFDEETLYYYI